MQSIDQSQCSYEIDSCIDHKDQNILKTGNERVYIHHGCMSCMSSMSCPLDILIILVIPEVCCHLFVLMVPYYTKSHYVA